MNGLVNEHKHNFDVERSEALLHAWELRGSIFGHETGSSYYRLS
jgi:hypothetical protein